jgi:hypothetical protein
MARKSATTAAAVPDTAEDATRARSAVRFPYYSLAQSIELARVINDRGGGQCSLDQLAGYLNQQKSGAFLSKLAAARLFGLVTNASDGFVRLTERARTILAPSYAVDADRARVEAFDGVPLFADVLRHFGSAQLPPQVGLDNTLEHQFHIAKGHAIAIARRTLLDSADEAGFFKARGGQRTHLVRPTFTDAGTPLVLAAGNGAGSPAKPDGGGRAELQTGLPKAIAGALAALPEPGSDVSQGEIEDLVTMFRIAVKRSYKLKDTD